MTAPFGKQFREEYFLKLDPKVVNVNHGSFGLTPDPLFDSYIKNIEKSNLFPEKSLRYDDRNDYINALKLLAEKDLLDCDYRSLAILDNASVAVNTVLRSYPFTRGDKIVVTSTTYKACLNTVRFLENRCGVELLVIELAYPLNNAQILKKFEDVFRTESPKLCLFDTVSSLPAIKLPFVQITELCRKYNVLSLIDGAHGIGLIELSMRDILPDFFISNLHKWLFVERGCAVLYVNEKHQRKIHTFPISHSYLHDDDSLDNDVKDMRFVDTFQFVGTTNKANISTIGEAIKFRRDICGGEVAIRKYCNELSRKVGEVLTKEIWPKTTFLDNDDDTAITAMINIETPMEQYITKEFDRNDLKRCLLYLEEKICLEHNTFVPFFINNNKVYARFSCQIYNEMDDFIYAGKVVLKEIKQFFENKVYNDLKTMPKSGSVFQATELST